MPLILATAISLSTAAIFCQISPLYEGLNSTHSFTCQGKSVNILNNASDYLATGRLLGRPAIILLIINPTLTVTPTRSLTMTAAQ